jgi:hypothetical protein
MPPHKQQRKQKTTRRKRTMPKDVSSVLKTIKNPSSTADMLEKLRTLKRRHKPWFYAITGILLGGIATVAVKYHTGASKTMAHVNTNIVPTSTRVAIVEAAQTNPNLLNNVSGMARNATLVYSSNATKNIVQFIPPSARLSNPVSNPVFLPYVQTNQKKKKMNPSSVIVSVSNLKRANNQSKALAVYVPPSSKNKTLMNKASALYRQSSSRASTLMNDFRKKLDRYLMERRRASIDRGRRKKMLGNK